MNEFLEILMELILDVLGLAFSCVVAFFTFQKTYQEDEDQQ